MLKGNIFSVALFFMLFGAIHQSHGASCPKDPIPDCECRLLASQVSVTCKKTKNFEAVRKQLAESVKGTIDLDLYHIDNTSFTSDMLQGLTVRFFKYMGPVKSIADDTFKDQVNSIIWIRFEDTGFKSFPIKPLSILKKLAALHMFGAVHTRVITKADMIQLPKSLRSIDIVGNGITSVEPQAFMSFENLHSLDLSVNGLESFPKDSLPASLSTLNLGHNKFTKIPVEAFANKQQGFHVSFLGDPLTEFPTEDVLKPVLEKGIFISARNNRIECNCALKWIATYREEHATFPMEGNCQDHTKAGSPDLLTFGQLDAKFFASCK